MAISPLAGKPAQRSAGRLGRLEREYYEQPDIGTRTAGQLRHQRASRLAARWLVHRSPYSRNHPGDLRLPAQQGIDGPLYMGKDTHALSEPAQRTALEVLAANDVEIMIDADNG